MARVFRKEYLKAKHCTEREFWKYADQSWVFSWLVHAYEETERKGKNHSKGLERIMPDTQTRPGIIPVSTRKTEEAMAPHSSTLAWKIPWTEEPGMLQSMGLLRVRQDWATSLLLFTFIHWRRKWQPTLVFLPGESQGQGSLAGCRLWGRTVGHDWSDLAAAAAATRKSLKKTSSLIEPWVEYTKCFSNGQ